MEPQKIILSEFPAEEVSALRALSIPKDFFATLRAALGECPPRKLDADEEPEEMPARIETIARTAAGMLFAHGKLPYTEYYRTKVPDMNIALAAAGSDLRLVAGMTPNSGYFLIRVT